MKISNMCKAALILLLNTATVYADTIYKSVDENGKVSYSTTPPTDNTDSSIVNISAPPSDKEIKAAKDRQEKNMEAARQFDENRQTRNEITEKENQQKRENQKQKQLQLEAENNNDNFDYGYPVPRRRPMHDRPVTRPPARPVTLPAR